MKVVHFGVSGSGVLQITEKYIHVVPMENMSSVFSFHFALFAKTI